MPTYSHIFTHATFFTNEHQADLVASAAAEAARVGSLATQKAGNLRGI